MNRREFFRLSFGAVVAAKVGVPLASGALPVWGRSPMERVMAQRWIWYIDRAMYELIVRGVYGGPVLGRSGQEEGGAAGVPASAQGETLS